MTSEEKIIAKYDEKIAKIAELEAVSQDHALADAARMAALAEMTAARQEEEDKVNAKRAEEAAKLAAENGVRDRAFRGERLHRPKDISSPSIIRDPDKCILCGKCVRVCEEVQGVSISGQP